MVAIQFDPNDPIHFADPLRFVEQAKPVQLGVPTPEQAEASLMSLLEGYVWTAADQALMGTVSPYVGLIDKPYKVVQHNSMLRQIEHMANPPEELGGTGKVKANSEARMARTQARAQALTVVTAAGNAWREAVAERDRIFQEQNTKVKLLNDEYKRLKAEHGVR